MVQAAWVGKISSGEGLGAAASGKWLGQALDSLSPVPPQAQLGRCSLLHPPPLREIHLPSRVSAALGGIPGGPEAAKAPGGGRWWPELSRAAQPGWLCCHGRFLLQAELSSTRGSFLSPPVLFVPGGCREGQRLWSSLCIPWSGRRGLSRKGRGVSPPAPLRPELNHPKCSSAGPGSR